MNAKMTAVAAALVLLSASSLPAAAQGAASVDPSVALLPPGTVLEGSVESSTDSVRFPSSLAGPIQAQSCLTCAVKLFGVDANTRFNLGGRSVSMQEMAAYCSRTSGKPLTVHYRLSDSVVSLVSVLAP